MSKIFTKFFDSMINRSYIIIAIADTIKKIADNLTAYAKMANSLNKTVIEHETSIQYLYQQQLEIIEALKIREKETLVVDVNKKTIEKKPN